MPVRCPLCLEEVRIDRETSFHDWPAHKNSVTIRQIGAPTYPTYGVDGACGTFGATRKSVSVMMTFDDECCPGTIWSPMFLKASASDLEVRARDYMKLFVIRWYVSTC